jgi:MFS family permease
VTACPPDTGPQVVGAPAAGPPAVGAAPGGRPGGPAGARRPSRLGQSRALRLLWAGQSVSLVGDQVTLLALPLAALAGGASAGQVAVLVGATRAPFLVIGLPAGVWVSRIGLRRSMLLADLLRAVALASIPITAAFGRLPYVLLLGVAAVLGCGTVLFQVAYQSLTPLLVEDIELLRSANTRLTASEALAQIGGPAVAGLLASAVGAARALAVDAASYLVSAGTLAALRAPADRPARGQRSMRSEIRGALRYVLAAAPLRGLLCSSMLFNFGVAGYEALLVVFAVRHLGLSPAILGLVIGIGGTGVPIGLLLSGPAERRFGVGRVLILSAALSGAGLLVVGTAGGRLAAAVIGAGTFVTAVGGGAWGLTALTTRQTLSRPDMRAMTTAVFRWATYGVLPLGALMAGLAASLTGPRPAIVLAGAIGQLCVLPLLPSPIRALRVLSPPAPAIAAGKPEPRRGQPPPPTE